MFQFVHQTLFLLLQGIYLEAAIQTQGTNGQAVTIRWVHPHNFTQFKPEGVDFRVMLTFFAFYETLLEFVLFTWYREVGIRYPLLTVTTASTKSFWSEDGGGIVTNNPSLHSTQGGKSTSVLSANISALQMAIHLARREIRPRMPLKFLCSSRQVVIKRIPSRRRRVYRS